MRADGDLGERKGASDARWGSTKDQTAPKGVRLLCWALRPTTEIPRVLASGFYSFFALVFPYVNLVEVFDYGELNGE